MRPGSNGNDHYMNLTNESEARQQIKEAVAKYYHDFKEKKDDFKPGDRITYASRVFDEKEMQALTDAMLDFWLTAGRFSEEFMSIEFQSDFMKMQKSEPSNLCDLAKKFSRLVRSVKTSAASIKISPRVSM